MPERSNTADEVVASSSDEKDVSKLRELLGVADADGVREIFRRLDDPEVLARDLSGVLPDAVMLSARSDNRLGDALEPAVQRAVHTAIHKDPGSFAHALYPAMAPTIRRAISETLRAMVQSLNEILKHVFSIQGFRWRWQAFRTRQPFAQVVLSQSLVFRVEQAFLIHRETGLLLQHVVDPAAEAQDPDLVSSMLTAIQDFVHDSFMVGEDEGLEDFRVGDLTVWLERGRDGVLAVAIRGNAPESIRDDLRETLRSIHLSHGDELSSFSGDSSVFDPVRADVESCLVSNYRRPSSRPSPVLWVLVTILVFMLGFWVVSLIRERQRLNTFLENLEASPGIAVTSWERSSGVIVVRGLRDPMAADPSEVARESGMGAAELEFHWEPFTSLDDDLVLERATRMLTPPKGVEFDFLGGKLTARGTASPAWIALAAERAPMIPGVDEFRHRGQQSQPSPELIELAARSETRLMRFPSLSAEFLEVDRAVLDGLADDLRVLIDTGSADGWRLDITLIGHADSTGNEALNYDLSDRRARALRDELTARGIQSDLLTVVGVGSSKSLGEDDDSHGRGDDRRVSVEIEFVAEAENGGR